MKKSLFVILTAAALVMAADGNFGKGRYLLKREASRIREALQ